MNANDIDKCVRLIGNGLRERRPEAEIAAWLVSAGVAGDVAPNLFADLKLAIQRGVQSVVIGVDDPPHDPLLLAAYRHGQSAFRTEIWSLRFGRLLRFALVVGVITLTVWLAVRGR